MENISISRIIIHKNISINMNILHKTISKAKK